MMTMGDGHPGEVRAERSASARMGAWLHVVSALGFGAGCYPSDEVPPLRLFAQSRTIAVGERTLVTLERSGSEASACVVLAITGPATFDLPSLPDGRALAGVSPTGGRFAMPPGRSHWVLTGSAPCWVV